MIPQVVASERGTAQTVYVVMHKRGYRTAIFRHKTNWKPLERGIIEGDNPVQVFFMFDSSILSSAGHEKSCRNPGGPSPKAKYYLATDSELVP